jgi:3-isopropylmalate dehydrogenase
MRRTSTVACLAGAGVGPELMAAATRALRRVSKLHAIDLADVHLPFADEAVTRCGHPLPTATRAGCRDADAILVGSPHDPALDGLKADLDLSWRVARVHVGSARDVLVVGAVGDWANDVAVRRAFACAAERRGRLVSVPATGAWRELVDAEHDAWPGLDVEHLSVGALLVRLREAAADVDVVVTEAHLVTPVADAAAHLSGSQATVAHAWLEEDGRGLFAPATCEATDVGGFDAANPTAMLLTASLLLAEGLGRRSAGRTLERAVSMVAARNGSAPKGTAAFTAAVLDLLPESRVDLELGTGAWAA